MPLYYIQVVPYIEIKNLFYYLPFKSYINNNSLNINNMNIIKNKKKYFQILKKILYCR